MNILSLVENLSANIVFAPSNAKSLEFLQVIAGDLMADLLVSQARECLLVTGLATEQTIRTADLLGCVAVLLVNEKLPSLEMKKLAEELNMPLLATALPMFETCAEIHTFLNIEKGPYNDRT